ncbi:DUF4890 domain-containing protein [Hymenobacter lucidus]|uniref:DUF4890 domain-containing protein n=1 Tax=Hymenobacter lucidus TaxID=2880930 RepID=A0ABS8AR27_9BACT|nr:DUF4890 domain-containing protein [Hymenobacter lucidus]MCB2408236.1 DUF4890 domain-containing protein [Hymenobacter lucidus]
MKTAFAFLTALALTTTTAWAQTAPSTTAPAGPAARHRGGRMAQATPEQRAEMMTKHLTQQLSLSTEQTARVQQLALTNTHQMEAVRSKYATAADRKGMGQELKTLKEQNDAQLKQILTAEQFTKYSQLQADRMAKRQQHGQGGKMKLKSEL